MRRSAKVALEVAADAALEGRDLVEAQFEALQEAAPLAEASTDYLDALVSAGAGCADQDTNDWYPTYGDGQRLTEAERVAERKLAAGLCAGCPVRAECLALSFAVRARGAWGVWGGLSQRDRAGLHPMWVELQKRLADAATPAAELEVAVDVQVEAVA